MGESIKLGKLMLGRRVALGLTQRGLSDQLGMDYTYICKIEKSERFPSAEFIPIIAEFLGISVDKLLRIIEEERVFTQHSKINKNYTFLPNEVIESFANRDRLNFLTVAGKSQINFPRDRDRVPKLLFGLNVIYDEVLYEANDRRIYAGLFPERYTYRGTSGVIAIATRQVRNQGYEDVSEETKTFQVLHELGHYVIQWQKCKEFKIQLPDRPIYCSSGAKSPLEYQANAYASAFLMPREELSQLIGFNKYVDIRRDSKHLCKHFFVEPWALKFRLGRLGLHIVD